MSSEERVGGGAAAVVLRTARELAQHPTRWLVALGRGDPRRKVRRGSAVDRARTRVQGGRGDDELPTRIGADRGVRTRTERRRAEIVDVRGKAQSEVADGENRGDAETALSELAGAPRTVEPDPQAAWQVDDLRPGGKRNRSDQRTDR